MKKHIYLFLAFILFFSCEKEDVTTVPEIKVGNAEESLSQVYLNKLTERKIILSGGDKKFKVAIKDSKIAKASINKDTLKIKGLFEGSTFASIKSYDKEIILNINVVPQQISISQKHIKLCPKDISRYVSVNGGGDVVSMEEIDPDDIIETKWNGKTGILEIKAHFEGNAKIRFSSENTKPKEVEISVKSEGNPSDIGIYSTINKSIYDGLKPIMIVKRKNIGTWLSVSTSPYGVTGVLSKKVVAKFPVIKDPKQGDYINIDVSFFPYVQTVSNVKNGKNKVYIEEVNNKSNTVLLRGRGFKIVLPIEK